MHPVRGEACAKADVVKNVGSSEKVAAAAPQDAVHFRQEWHWQFDVLKHIIAESNIEMSIGERQDHAVGDNRPVDLWVCEYNRINVGANYLRYLAPERAYFAPSRRARSEIQYS
jgi:hypothetical protein